MTINLSTFAPGTELKVRCRDGKTRTVIANRAKLDGPCFPHQIEGEGYSFIRSVTNAGRIYLGTEDDWDVQEILNQPTIDRSKPVVRGYNRHDKKPDVSHGSVRWKEILWRDSSDNGLELYNFDDEVPNNFDQWFPLNEIEFQVEEVSESLRLHREAKEVYVAAGSLGDPEGFTRGYLRAKRLAFRDEDFRAAFAS